VRNAPAFADVWADAVRMTEGAEFLAAHNASFDRSVLRACCERYGLAAPATPFECTVAMARRTLGIFPTKLPDVCRHLRIPLKHHDAMSDAEACARIVLAVAAARA
jgi:DNA polymerase-3 subunit epsilon